MVLLSIFSLNNYQIFRNCSPAKLVVMWFPTFFPVLVVREKVFEMGPLILVKRKFVRTCFSLYFPFSCCIVFYFLPFFCNDFFLYLEGFLTAIKRSKPTKKSLIIKRILSVVGAGMAQR